ncbi:MAG: ribonuclease III domain-containing protein [Christensenellaceae bacterium]
MFVELNKEKVLSISEATQIAPLTLAYIGDSIFDLYVRTKYILGCSKNAGALHVMSIKIVNAKSQAVFAHEVLEDFTQEERDVFMRGRNAKSSTTPKNMSIADYKYATAIEAVVGYLYLTGQTARINDLLGRLEFDL